MIVTLWYRKLKNDIFEYNHFEEGISPDTHPKIVFESSLQRAWESYIWEKRIGYLDSNNCIVAMPLLV